MNGQPWWMDEPVRSSRIWFSGGGWDCPWYRPLILAGVHGGDENCNRTVGLKVPGGALFLCLNLPLRQKPHRGCVQHRKWAGEGCPQ